MFGGWWLQCVPFKEKNEEESLAREFFYFYQFTLNPGFGWRLKIFSICHRCRWRQWCTLSYEYLHEFSKKIKTALLRGLGETAPWKKPEVDYLVFCPFKHPFRRLWSTMGALTGTFDRSSCRTGRWRDPPWSVCTCGPLTVSGLRTRVRTPYTCNTVSYSQCCGSRSGSGSREPNQCGSMHVRIHFLVRLKSQKVDFLYKKICL